MSKKLLLALLAALLLIFVAACNSDEAEDEIPSTAVRQTIDRDGNEVTLPERINRIISIGPSNTEILAELGFLDRIIYTDSNSFDVPGLNPDIAVLNMMALDVEFLVAAEPDIVLITVMSRGGGDDPLRAMVDMGFSVLYVPTSVSIAEIKDDIRFVADVMGVHDAGEEIVSSMETEINNVRAIAETISGSRTVYFEISPAPWMFSFGSGTFLNEIIELVGGTNIFHDQEVWLGVGDEILLELNPEVILTSTDFLPDPVADIMERPGFDSIAAVQSGNVFSIDANASSRPSHNIIQAIREIANAIFPEYFS